MSGKSLAMMPWFPRDFIAATRGWRLLERALYRELLDAQWELGDLPTDQEELARIAGASESEFGTAWTRVSGKFEANASGRLRNVRLEEHREKAVRIKSARAEAGKIGGRVSVQSRKANDQANASAIEEATRQAIVNPPTPTPTPYKESVVVRASEELAEAGKLARALITLGVNVTSMNPTLIGWVQSGFTIDRISEAVLIAKNNGKESIPANYLDKILRQPIRPPPSQLDRVTWRPPPDEATG